MMMMMMMIIVVVVVVMMMMMATTTTTTTTITIVIMALKGAVHCPGAIISVHVQNVEFQVVTKDSSAVKFDRAELAFIFALSY